MSDGGIGRVLVASLHQGISEILPARLVFYEEWLNAEGMRGGTIGLAPVLAVLSFLRQEGDAYRGVTNRAGECAAEWTVETMPRVRRSLITASPEWLRSRIVIYIAGRIVRESYQASRAVSKVRRGTARVELLDSIFCSVREPVGRPLCCFYAAMFKRLLTLFNIDSSASIVACRGTGAHACTLTIPLGAMAELGAPEATGA